MLTDLWPTTGVQFTSDEHAAILAGLVVKNTSGVPRTGVLPRHTNPLVTGRPDMRVNVLPMELVHVKEGARFVALTEAIDVAIPNPPVANTQYHIVCYVGTDEKLTGVASTSDFVVVSGTASATPSDPALPDAAVPIARVAVPSTATATNSGVTITPLHPFTTTSGGMLLFRTSAEMGLWAAATGQEAYVLNGGSYIRDGSVWRGRGQLIASSGSITSNPPLGSELLEIAGVVGSTTSATGAQNIPFPGGGFPNGIVSMSFTLTNNSQASDVRLVHTSTTKGSFQVFAPGKANTYVEMAYIARGW